MQMTISFTPKDFGDLINEYLTKKGFVVKNIKFNVTAGCSDQREYEAPGLKSVEVSVEEAPKVNYRSSDLK